MITLFALALVGSISLTAPEIKEPTILPHTAMVEQSECLVIEEGVDKNNANLAISYLDKIPDNILQHFSDSGWKVVVSAQKLNTRKGYAFSIQGLTSHEEGIIYLDNRAKAIKGALVHEFGHYTDSVLGRPSDSDEFLAIFEAEKYSFVDSTATGDGHEISSNREYFASVFSEAIINPQGCLATAPRSYEFVIRQINSL